MLLNDNQARELLMGAGVPVPASEVVTTSDEAVAAYKGIGGKVGVKAQVFEPSNAGLTDLIGGGTGGSLGGG